MLQIKNKTPFVTEIVPSLDKNEHEFATVIIKGSFLISPKKKELSISEEPVPVTLADQFYGEPGSSSITYASDTAFTKKGTDVVMIGHAFTRRDKEPFVDVTLQAGSLAKSVRVFGDRHWYKFLGMWKKSPPKPFEKMALCYEHAFGGKDASDPDPARHDYEKRNPVGKGFCISNKNGGLEGLCLPNLEDPRSLMESWKDKPAPAGFGFIGPDWMPRITYAGTYDQKWREKRCPLLPEDFDERFFNSAAPDLISRNFLKGGEEVRISGASPTGDVVFHLPEKRIHVELLLRGKRDSAEARLDTVIIEPDGNRVLITWRAVMPVFRQFIYIDHVIIQERK